METMEALNFVRAEIASAGTDRVRNLVCVGICRNVNTGELFTQVQKDALFARVEIVRRHNGTARDASLRILIPGIGYEDKFKASLTEKTIRAKVAKAVTAWNEAADRRNAKYGPLAFRKDPIRGALNDWFEVVTTICSGYEAGMDYNDGLSWSEVTFPALVRAYKEYGANHYGYESAIKEAANA